MVDTDAGTRAYIYCRVSTDDKGQTNETQERVCRQFCESKGIQILGVYKDEMTGTTIERPGFSALYMHISMHSDADWIVAYDQSRITRGTDIEEIKERFAPFRCRFRFVKLDMDDTQLPGQIVQDVMSRVNAHENVVRAERTAMGMKTRSLSGVHVGRPARFMVAEDVPNAPQGRFKAGVTQTCEEWRLYAWAEQGLSLYEVAKTKLFMDPDTLIREMRPRDASNPKCQNKGIIDRYAPYMARYRLAKEHAKGCTLERVGKPEENALERVGVE